jgi:hypothetical protein
MTVIDYLLIVGVAGAAIYTMYRLFLETRPDAELAVAWQPTALWRPRAKANDRS